VRTTVDVSTLAPLVAISPHLDDAVLSCGALLAAVPGSVVVTVFAGAPPSYDGVTSWDASCGFALGDDIVAMRHEEDRRALAQLGATPRWLDFLDNQYATEPAAIEEIAAAIAVVVRELEPATLAFPLGLNHPDHQQVHEACRRLLETEPGLARQWVAFADVPYRMVYGAQARSRLAVLQAVGFRVEHSSAETDERKAAAVAAYSSQLLGLGASVADAAEPEDHYALVSVS
jgi:LmbE family N-acetylglucosaminyl deacetylase